MLRKRREISLASVDSTGFDAHHISRYFYRQRMRSYKNDKESVIRRRFPKLAIIIDCNSHLILSAVGSRGPCPDIAQLEKSLNALPKLKIKCLVADAGYDSEGNHEKIRALGIRSIIPPWHGPNTKNAPKGRWRRKMFFRFLRKTPPIYKQRWQVETTFSMMKRNLSANIASRSHHAHRRELFLKVLAHNAMVLWDFITGFSTEQTWNLEI